MWKYRRTPFLGQECVSPSLTFQKKPKRLYFHPANQKFYKPKHADDLLVFFRP